MSIKNAIKSICKSLGENNKPTYVVMSIAMVKGIFRPIFTMMDKKENPETKKYTALREGLTEVIAIPVYWACGEVAGKFGKSIVSKGMDKKFQAEAQKGRAYTDEVKTEMKNVNISKGQKGLMFIGVCTAALFIIPAVCSLAIKPIMNVMGLKAPNNPKKKDKAELDIIEGLAFSPMNKTYSNTVQINASKYNNVIHQRPQTGMKVGGV